MGLNIINFPFPGDVLWCHNLLGCNCRLHIPLLHRWWLHVREIVKYKWRVHILVLSIQYLTGSCGDDRVTLVKRTPPPLVHYCCFVTDEDEHATITCICLYVASLNMSIYFNVVYELYIVYTLWCNCTCL